MEHVIFWQMARFESDLDDTELDGLLRLEGRSEAYVEFLDGRRRRLVWDHERRHWVGPRAGDRPAA
jgi:hypothetical protein